MGGFTLVHGDRAILVDSLYGKVHRRYGAVSNMSWIIDHTGHIGFRASWTVAQDVEAALKEVIRTREIRREGRGSSYYREIVGSRPSGIGEDAGRDEGL